MARYKIPGADEARGSSANSSSAQRTPSYPSYENTGYDGIKYNPPKTPAIPAYSLIAFDENRKIMSKKCRGNLLGSVYNLDEKTQKRALILCRTLSLFSAHYIYLGYYKKAKLHLIIEAVSLILLLIGFASSKLIFVIPFAAVFSYISIRSYVDTSLLKNGRMLRNTEKEQKPKIFEVFGKLNKEMSKEVGNSTRKNAKSRGNSAQRSRSTMKNSSGGGTRYSGTSKGGTRYGKK